MSMLFADNCCSDWLKLLKVFSSENISPSDLLVGTNNAFIFSKNSHAILILQITWLS
jgi:hypothetical protein